MSEHYLALPANDQKEILQTASAELGRQATVLEKDIWVCWALQTLFAMPDAHPMAFKGGTSLSKVYNAIDRFSEDVDVTLDYRYFESFDPFAETISKSQIKKFTERLKGHVQSYTNDNVVPFIREALNQLPGVSQNTIEIDGSGEKIWISYPSVTEISDEYLKSQILVEFGGRNVIDPHECHTITPDIASLVPDLVYPTGEVTVLSAQRTFWEKATLIHVACNRGQLKSNMNRLSRHWYDLVMLAKREIGRSAIMNRELFEDVIRHKQVFFNSSYANYDACLDAKLKLLPESAALNDLRIDYEKMISAGMLYDNNILFDEIVTSLREVERAINTW